MPLAVAVLRSTCAGAAGRGRSLSQRSPAAFGPLHADELVASGEGRAQQALAVGTRVLLHAVTC